MNLTTLSEPTKAGDTWVFITEKPDVSSTNLYQQIYQKDVNIDGKTYRINYIRIVDDYLVLESDARIINLNEKETFLSELKNVVETLANFSLEADVSSGSGATSGSGTNSGSGTTGSGSVTYTLTNEEATELQSMIDLADGLVNSLLWTDSLFEDNNG